MPDPDENGATEGGHAVDIAGRSKHRWSSLAVEQQLRCCLGRCETMNVDAIAQQTGLARETVAERLNELVSRNEVEILKPIVGNIDKGDGRPLFHPAVYFRLVRASDDDYLWEQDLVVRLPTRSVHEEREFEARRAAFGARRFGWRRRLEATAVGYA